MTTLKCQIASILSHLTDTPLYTVRLVISKQMIQIGITSSVASVESVFWDRQHVMWTPLPANANVNKLDVKHYE